MTKLVQLILHSKYSVTIKPVTEFEFKLQTRSSAFWPMPVYRPQLKPTNAPDL